MRLRDKVAAMFNASGSSCSSDEDLDYARGSHAASEHSVHIQELRSEASSHKSPSHLPFSASKFGAHALDTPAPQKHPRPANHTCTPNGHASSLPVALRFQARSQQRGPHILLLAMRKGTLDGLVKRHASVPKDAISLLLAASSLVLPPGKSNWAHVQSLIQQRRFITMLSRAVLEIDSQSPSLLLPRNYLSNHATPPVFETSSEASQGLTVIHNWIVCICACILEEASLLTI